MAWVRAERSSEAEKNIKKKGVGERRHNDNDGETFDSWCNSFGKLALAALAGLISPT